MRTLNFKGPIWQGRLNEANQTLLSLVFDLY